VITETELRITLPNYYQNSNFGNSFGTGLGEMTIGVKQQLGPIRDFGLAAIASVSFPTAAQSTSSHAYDATVQAAWSRKLHELWTIGGMFSGTWPTQMGHHNVTGNGIA
jgi:hypothetical protein